LLIGHNEYSKYEEVDLKCLTVSVQTSVRLVYVFKKAVCVTRFSN